MAGAGQPTIYTTEIAIEICTAIATDTVSLKSLCKRNEHFPSVATIFNWLSSNKEFLDLYTRAKEQQADMMAEDILDIADDGSNDFMTITKGDMSYEVENKEWTSRSKLRIESRKWLAAKLLPKKYSEKSQIENKHVFETGAVIDWTIPSENAPEKD